MNKDLKKTNYVVVAYYDNEEYLEDCCLLGWNSREDWIDTDYYGDAIMTPAGNIKKNKFGILIKVSTHTSVYVGETYDDCKTYCDMGNQEGLNCRICKLEKDTDGNWKVIPISL